MTPTSTYQQEREPFLDAPFRQWPRLHQGDRSFSFSSFDRRGGNADGFRGSYSALYQRDDGQYVLFDALGPGVLDTLWFTGPDEGGEGLDLGTLRFYLDGEQRPLVELNAVTLFSGRHPWFPRPLVADNTVSTGGFVSWVPIPFAKRLVITTSKLARFYGAHYRRLPGHDTLVSWRPCTTKPSNHAKARELFRRALLGQLQTSAPRKVSLAHRQHGSGVIELVRFTPHSPASAARLHRARIQIRFDGERQPSIDTPMGMFFGAGLHETTINAVAFSMRPGGSYENRLPMPFWRSFSITVEGMEGQLELAVAPQRFRRADSGYLTTSFRQENVRPLEDFLWVDLPGQRGKLVATVLAVIPAHRHEKRWWEGDLRSTVDGSATPAIHGTGIEDDHFGGWSNTFFSRPFSLPMHGEPTAHIIEREGQQHNAMVSLYRLWPGISFDGGLRHGLEHGSGNQVEGRYRGLAFYYRAAAALELVETDRLDVHDRASRQTHQFNAGPTMEGVAFEASFEGEASEEIRSGLALLHGEARFLMKVPRDTQGCYLRWRYAKSGHTQRATVRIDGVATGSLFCSDGIAVPRWAEQDLYIPKNRLMGRTQVLVEIRPEGRFSATQYRLLCLRHIPSKKL